MNITTSIEGIPELVQAIKRLDNDVQKRREIIKILKRSAKPYQAALRSGSFVPKADKSVKYSRNKSIVYEPGNLRKSMKQYSNKKNSKGLIYVHTGPQTKKAEGSGYYGYFLLPGSVKKGWQAGTTKTDWKGEAWRSVESKVRSGTNKELVDYIKKNAKRLGFDVT